MILYIGNKLSKHGYTPTSVDTLGEKLKEHYDVITISSKKNIILRFIEMVGTIIKLNKKIELLLIDTYSTRNFYYAVVAARLARVFSIPYIPILHGGNLSNRLENHPNTSRALFKNSFANVSPSHFLFLAFSEHNYKVKYIPNSIEMSLYPKKVRKNISPRLLYVRSFHQIYNPELAIRILKELSVKYEDAKLCMVGPDKDGSLQKVKLLAKELGVLDKVEFTGTLSKAEWIKLSSGYDIFINTTNFDNHPVSVIEAMALGFPVVSTNVGGLPYLIEDGKDGFLVPPQEVKGFVEKIDLLVNSPELTEAISINARLKVEEYDWNKVILKWKDLFDSVLYQKAKI